MEKKQSLKKWILPLVLVMIGLWVINNVAIIGNAINGFISIVFPFILGAAIAFILNIPMSFFEKKFKNKKTKKCKNKKTIRVISLILAIIVIVFIISLVIKLIVPELINIGKILIDNIPYYTEELNKLIVILEEKIPNINDILNIDLEKIKNDLLNQIPTLVSSSFSVVGSIIGGIADFIIAIIFAIYILMSKDKLKVQAKMIFDAYCKKEKSKKIMNIAKLSNDTFKNFFTIQCLEATILGSLCIIGMLILKIPYAVPIGILIGVTALIPIVGAFIGAIIGSILILSVDPLKVITFIIFIIILQQVEGNLIYPRVVGKSIGLPGMWVLVAVSVGGSLFGILGMLLGVPTATILYTLLKEDVKKKRNLKKELVGEK